MSELFFEMAALDRFIHEPARLTSLTTLSACRRANFLYLQRLTDLTEGNLASHLTKLEAAGFVHIEKLFVGKVPSLLRGIVLDKPSSLLIGGVATPLVWILLAVLTLLWTRGRLSFQAGPPSIRALDNVPRRAQGEMGGTRPDSQMEG